MTRLGAAVVTLCFCGSTIAGAELTRLTAVYRAGKALQAASDTAASPGGPLVETAIQTLKTEILIAEDAVTTANERRALATYKEAVALFEQGLLAYDLSEQQRAKARVLGDAERIPAWPLAADVFCGFVPAGAGGLSEVCAIVAIGRGAPAALAWEVENRNSQASVKRAEQVLYQRSVVPRMSDLDRKLYAEHQYWENYRRDIADQIFALEMQTRVEQVELERRAFANAVHGWLVEQAVTDAKVRLAEAMMRREDGVKKLADANALYLAPATLTPAKAPIKK